MQIRDLAIDMGAGMIGGLVGTKLMEPVAMKLYEWEPEEARQQEDAVRPGPPYQIAADKAVDRLGLELDESQRKAAGLGFHLGLGMAWGPVYTILRRTTNVNPVVGGLVTGAAMSLIADELMTPATGASAPNREYPLEAHLRGFVAHLAFGLGVAATAELLFRLGRNLND